MHIRHVVPFLLLFAWQVAPGHDLREAPSRLKIWLGGGASTFDLWESTDCSGETYTERETWSGWGAQVDAWPSPSVRVSGAYASMEDRGRLLGMVAWETSIAGLGVGWSGGPDRVGYEGPSAYVRLGPLDHVHARAELRSPTPIPGVTGWARAGLAGNMGRRRGGGFFFGVAAVKACADYPCPATTPLDVTDKLGVFADADLALGSMLGLFARGHLASHARGFGLGVSIRLAR